MEKQKWWGYRHKNGTIQVKTFYDQEDVRAANESPFCARVIGPFMATGRDEASKIVSDQT